jgi:uncharacterized membrane protein YecN with MAPEG domain
MIEVDQHIFEVFSSPFSVHIAGFILSVPGFVHEYGTVNTTNSIWKVCLLLKPGIFDDDGMYCN